MSDLAHISVPGNSEEIIRQGTAKRKWSLFDGLWAKKMTLKYEGSSVFLLRPIDVGPIITSPGFRCDEDMRNIGKRALVMFSLFLMASVSHAEHGDGASGGTATQYTTVCDPDTAITVYTPTTFCNTQTIYVPTGITECSQSAEYASGSADFAGEANCKPQTTPQQQTTCNTVDVASTQVVKGQCRQVPVVPVDPCAHTQSHHCNNGGGPGG
jgi:hypothetical protein